MFFKNKTSRTSDFGTKKSGITLGAVTVKVGASSFGTQHRLGVHNPIREPSTLEMHGREVEIRVPNLNIRRCT